MFRLFYTLFVVALLVSFANSQSFNCNPACVSPALCDTNTGVCRNFRTAFNGPVSIGCSTICPAGTSCDTNTGICRTFRMP
ncbi:hypothetical protein CRE_00203 [Caenorhabditis remanei]|uniref:Uncharacterized protein n=1 Tax=Caenorhabditis remanei TaxID=31234 RepID=E3LDR9_CAERE|nr:hypothetical protein CRE_00203 [Caenorhabditis remanei]